MNNKKLFLIDAYTILYQGYYAFIKKPLLTSKGINTSPILNFTSLLMNLLNEEKPSYMATIFDYSNQIIRKKEYHKYKDHRKKKPKDISIAIPYLIKILKSFRIYFLYAKYGYEADDVIGTIAKKAEKKGYMIYIITLDKDFCQLVTKNIKIYRPPFKGEPKRILGIEEIKENFGVSSPKKVIDLWSMMGDSSDNIPGLPGIGEKKAKEFIQKYGSLEKFLNSTHHLRGKIKKNIEKNKKLGFLSKKLATIVTNIPLFYFHEEKFYIKKPNWNSIEKIFLELEFKILLKKAYQYYLYKNSF
ncbi:MAG: DNA polymerase I [Flavobacteriales bacterium]|jgi:DNA polymerase-1|uniref:5'-3' exonuclease n=1 Tax=Blattabacterium sp. (Mastotermes darwiniensis) TaxID=39768 RepID=UPI000231DF69|nr:5'-3' exonuclease H3TH domain-containing protein [Blattabacterium sp. (Mastotermes darwiniensis)]AER40385.1 DNA polymerase I [Blattabacterium sp. (Mastotermes darwiniensis) str. MADAR]MDR1804894.1 DNA polymerase I [Flavobacteriales bacterium]